MLQIRLLGQFDVRVEGQRLVLASRASQSLFAYLVLHAGTPQRREKLAGLFWGDTTEELARKYLRNELWRVRKAIQQKPNPGEELLVSDEFSIVFNRDAPYWLDVAALESAPDVLDSLVSTLSLYRGELLPGFYDDWILFERERVRGVFENKLALLLDKLIGEQRWNLVSEWAERWIALGQTPEPAYRALMMACAAQGDSAKLALVYDRCVQAMQNDLGLEPSAETRILYEQLAKEMQVSSRAAAFQLPAMQTSGTVTFLFTDIEGSTRLLETLGEDYSTLLKDQRDLLRASAEKWNGQEVDKQGDAFFFAFLRAADAMGFAADSQRALAHHKFPRDAVLRVRMGIHTGEPMLARTGYIGMDVHRAARIAAAGHGGQVLISQSTRELVRSELPPETLLVDLGEHKLKDLRYPVRIFQLSIQGLPNEFPPLKSLDGTSEPPAPGEPPFKGLEFFDEKDAALFFGREGLTAKLHQRVRSANFLAVVIGASGSGKSSIVRAGVVPALRGDVLTSPFQIFIMTPTAHPLEALALVFTRSHESVTATATLMDDLERDPRSLYLFLRRDEANSPDKMVLVVDQFEELFTLCNDEYERQAFIDNLLYVVAHSGGLALILTLRADFYSHLAPYPELRELVAEHQEYIGPMNTEELRRAIEEPAKIGGWEFEPGLVDLMLRDAGDEPGTLPLLSHALLETWKRRSGHTLTVKGYHGAGGVRGAIAQTADSVFQALTEEQQGIARNVFLRLTRLGEGTEDTRRRATMEELIPRAADAAQVRAVVTQLADARLVTTSEQGIEVAHEALIREWRTLREWLDQDREGLRVHQHLTEAAHEWELLERDTGALYRGAHLAQVQEYAAAHPDALNDRERAFLEASVEYTEREAREREELQERELVTAQALAETQTNSARQLRRRAVFLAVALLAALLLAGLALLLSNQAQASALAAAENARLATSRELAASALNQIEVDPERAIWLGMHAVKTTYDVDGTVLPEAADALHRAIQGSHIEHVIRGLVPPINSVAFSPDGTRIVTANQNNLGKVYDAVTGTELLTLEGHEPASPPFNLKKHITDARYTPDGKQIVTAAQDNTIRFWDAASGKELRTLTGGSGGINSVALTKDGRYIAAGDRNGSVFVWEIASGEQVFTKHVEGTISQVAVSPDGKYIAAASEQHREFDWAMPLERGLYVWNLESGESVSGFPDVRAQGVAIGPDSRLLAVGDFSGNVNVWDMATRTEQLTYTAHDGATLAVAFSPDGKHLASAGADQQVKILDLETGEPAHILEGQTGWVWSLDYSPNGRQLVSSSNDGTVFLWDVTSGTVQRTVQNPFDAAGALGGDWVRFSPDGNRVAFTTTESGIKILDVKSDPPGILFNLPGPSGASVPFGFSADGSRLATKDIGKDGNSLIRIWDISGSGPEAQEVSSVTLPVPYWHRAWGILNPDLSQVVLSSPDATFEAFDLETGASIRKVDTQFEPPLYIMASSPDGKTILAGSGVPPVKAWDLESGKELFELPIVAIWAAYSPDGTRIATGSDGGIAQIWDAETGNLLQTMQASNGILYYVSFSHDGEQIITSSIDATAKVWDVATGQLLYTLAGHGDSVVSAAFSPDGSHIVTTGGDGAIRFWNTTLRREGAKFPGILAWSGLGPAGKHFYTAEPGDELTIRQYEVINTKTSPSEPRETFTLPSPASEFEGILLDPSWTLMTNGYANGKISVHEAATGKELFAFQAHGGQAYGGQINADRTRLLTFSDEGVAKVWDITTALQTGVPPVQEVFALTGHGYAVNWAMFNHDGTRIVTGTSVDGVIKIWDSATGEELQALDGHSGSLFTMAYSPDGKQLASGSRDATTIIWDVETGNPLMTLRGHRGAVAGLTYSHDSRWLATTSLDETTKIWDLATGAEILSLDTPPGPIGPSLTFSADDTRLYVTTQDGVREFILPIEDLMELARSRVTRTLTTEECNKYLKLETCPSE